MRQNALRPWLARKGDVLNPGRPWGIVTEWTREECTAIGDSPNDPLRTTVIAEILDGPTAEGDARLIALAPCMFEILIEGEEIISGIEAEADNAGIDLHEVRAWWQRAQTAIAKKMAV